LFILPLKHLFSPITQILTTQMLTPNLLSLKFGHFKVFSDHSIAGFYFLIVQAFIYIPHCTSTSPLSLSANFTAMEV